MRAFLFFMAAMLSFPLFSQVKYREAKNSIIANFGGGVVGSLEYERAWFARENQFMISSIGLGAGVEGQVYNLFGDVEDPEWYVISQQKLTYNIGLETNFFEFGLGGIYVSGNTTQPYIAYPILGYRFIGENNSTFKVYIAWPFSGIETDDLGFFPIGINFGQFF